MSFSLFVLHGNQHCETSIPSAGLFYDSILRCDKRDPCLFVLDGVGVFVALSCFTTNFTNTIT